MKIFYVTLNNASEANQISFDLLEKRLAVCTNLFPITCTYRWQGEIKQEPEVVLIIKTMEGLRNEIEVVIGQHVSYTNFIAELEVHSINAGFMTWLTAEVQRGNESGS
jgi:periplasmic divalent cation tolerance protein